jgi:hypothetical protein
MLFVVLTIYLVHIDKSMLEQAHLMVGTLMKQFLDFVSISIALGHLCQWDISMISA